jgi:hypothetical protein
MQRKKDLTPAITRRNNKKKEFAPAVTRRRKDCYYFL